MVGGRVTCCVNSARPCRIFLGQFTAVPVLHAVPSRPCSRRRMFGVRFPPTLLTGKNRSHARCVNNPARTNRPGAFTITKCDRLLLPAAVVHRLLLQDAKSQRQQHRRAAAPLHQTRHDPVDTTARAPDKAVRARLLRRAILLRRL